MADRILFLLSAGVLVISAALASFGTERRNAVAALVVASWMVALLCVLAHAAAWGWLLLWIFAAGVAPALMGAAARAGVPGRRAGSAGRRWLAGGGALAIFALLVWAGWEVPVGGDAPEGAPVEMSLPLVALWGLLPTASLVLVGWLIRSWRRTP